MAEKQKREILQEEIERRVLFGLSCEWKNALWMLDPSDRKRMHIPLFVIKGLKNEWGQWSPKKREISISRRLILNHSWDSVREVLLHEIAHQYTDMVLCAQNEPPHGLSFQKACYILRANPKASGHYPPLDDRISHHAIRDEDRILIKVKKLMALAESQNPYEAEAALAKAHMLITRYNLDHLAHQTHRDFISVFLGKPALRHNRADYLFAHILQDFYFVQGIWMPAFVIEKGKMGRVLEISGTIQNIQMAAYVYDFVRHFINTRWRHYNLGKGLNHFRKVDFAVGILGGFRSKLESKKAVQSKMPGTKHVLVKAEDTLLQSYFRYRYPRTTTFSRGIYARDDTVLRDGKRIGKELVLSKGIGEKRHHEKLLIGN